MLVLGLVLATGFLIVLCGVGFWFTARQQARVAAEREVAEARMMQAQLALENQRQRQAARPAQALPLYTDEQVIRYVRTCNQHMAPMTFNAGIYQDGTMASWGYGIR